MLRVLAREYPFLAIVVSSRRHAIGPPLDGRSLTIRNLTANQRKSIIHARNASLSAEILGNIRTNPSLDKITRTPLFLSIYLDLADRRNVPLTKEGMIRAFVAQSEANRDHHAALLQSLAGKRINGVLRTVLHSRHLPLACVTATDIQIYWMH